LIDYSRPISIDEKGNFEVNDDDFMYLFNTTITKMILGKMNSLCSVCQSPQDANQLLKLNCSCCFCEKCFSNFIDKATDGKIVMNLYEKSNYIRMLLKLHHLLKAFKTKNIAFHLIKLI